jgi:integrase
VTRYALQLAPLVLVFVRPGERRKADWSEIDLEAGEWRIPAERMKMKTKHIVPLSSQAVAILRALQPLTGKGHCVLPGARLRFAPRLSHRLSTENTPAIEACGSFEKPPVPTLHRETSHPLGTRSCLRFHPNFGGA